MHAMDRSAGLRAPLALLAAALLAAGCGGGGEEAAAAGPVAVTVGAENVLVAARGEIRSGPLLSGSLKAREEATIRAEVGGTVLEVVAEEGQVVRAGQLLGRIEEGEVRDAYTSSQSSVSTAQNAVEIARRDLERNQTLAQAGAVPARNVETARIQLSNAQSQLAQARAGLASSRERLESARITAPISGVVSRRAANRGDVVAPGAELFTVINPRTMTLEASVPSEQLAALRVGTPVEFQVRGFPGQSFTGRIERVSPVADEATRQVPIFVTIPNVEGRLVSGLFAEGRVESEVREGLIVPATVVNNEGNTPTVMRLRGGKAEAVPVVTGIEDTSTERVEIVSGIAAGDTLLAGAARQVTPGTQVRIGRASPQPAAR